jgi:hypothetical protein
MVNGKWKPQEPTSAAVIHKKAVNGNRQSQTATTIYHSRFTIYGFSWQEGNPQGRSEAVIEPA